MLGSVQPTEKPKWNRLGPPPTGPHRIRIAEGPDGQLYVI